MSSSSTRHRRPGAASIDDPREVPQAAGSFDEIECPDGAVRLVGWMLDPEIGAFETIRVLWNGTDLGTADRKERADVAEVLPWAERAEASGFEARVEPGGRARGRLDLIGLHRDQPVARRSIALPEPESVAAPFPPGALQERVAGIASRGAFLAQGLQGLLELLDAIERHGDRARITRVLDWGCGCGRVTRHLPSAGFRSVFGADIDREAIAWCQENLPGAEYATVRHHPPLPYGDSSMDLIFGYSVFTHLSAADQASWLAELDRILAPGGLILASTHGEFSYRLARGQDGPAGLPGRRRLALLVRELDQAGIHDAGADVNLAGITPPGYYRSTYQSSEYTLDRWSEKFEILEYVERGLMGTQDLVVMRGRTG